METGPGILQLEIKIQGDYYSSRNQPSLMDYRLPTETEWEYAARGGKKFSMYPWGGYYTRDSREFSLPTSNLSGETM
jgi:hypothetical protein